MFRRWAALRAWAKKGIVVYGVGEPGFLFDNFSSYCLLFRYGTMLYTILIYEIIGQQSYALFSSAEVADALRDF